MSIVFRDENCFELDGITFEYGFRQGHGPSSPRAAFVLKQRAQIERYEELLAGREVRNVVELGICFGGSAIFLDRLLHPRRLVAVDIATAPATALTHYHESSGRSDALRAHYGVDQSDKARLSAILDDAFGDEPIDLVIDDASHLYGPTVASFEAIFPRLRPGALYIVEDWDASHVFAAGIQKILADPTHPQYPAAVASQPADHPLFNAVREGAPSPELGRFAMQAALMVAGTRDLVREVRVRSNWIILERGSASIDAATARIDELACDRFRVLRPLAETSP